MTELEHPKRYPGARWALLYGAYTGCEVFAVHEMQRLLQHYLPYAVTVQQATALPGGDESLLALVGTPANNPYLAELIERGLLAAPSGEEGYSIACLDAPWEGISRVLAVAGADAKGVINGVVDLGAKELALTATTDEPAKLRETLDTLPGFARSEAPAIAERGIWTWGYVIYDYRRFLENMARLKMNFITVWNDEPPVNARQFVDAAHALGIRVYAGYHWGWGYLKLDPSDAALLQATKDEVIRKYREQYRDLGIDGLYLQTFTETTELERGGRSIAAQACEWVNAIADGLFAIEPKLHIRFGLHGTSIGDNLEDLASLDPRITIVWEDCGVLPYTYSPMLEFPEGMPRVRHELGSFDATLAYSKRMAVVREGTPFAIVAKGWSALRWETEFDHHQSFILGERSPEYIRRRLQERQPMWDRHNALWMQYYPAAVRFYREMLDVNPHAMSVEGLVEDGMLEERIQPSVALFAETLWNPRQEESAILRTALSPYYMGSW